MGTPLIKTRSDKATLHPLDGAESAFLVGKRTKNLDHWPKFLANRVRDLYFKLGVVLFGEIHGMSICTNKDLAVEFARRPGGFVLELPVDECLPDKRVQFGYHDFPNSEASDRYKQRRLRYAAFDILKLRKLSARVADLHYSISSVNGNGNGHHNKAGTKSDSA